MLTIIHLDLFLIHYDILKFLVLDFLESELKNIWCVYPAEPEATDWQNLNMKKLIQNMHRNEINLDKVAICKWHGCYRNLK